MNTPPPSASLQPLCPVLGICGFSGAGKTTLIEQILPSLTARGFSVAVVKHDAHGIQVDRPGKDSDRLFRAGAAVLLQGPDEALLRSRHGPCRELRTALDHLALQHDLILLEGHKGSPCPKIWLQSRAKPALPDGVGGVLDSYAFDAARPARLLAFLDEWLPRQWRTSPIYGCVLIGGGSRRMGRAKHLIQREGRSWLEHTVETLAPMCERLVISGAGDVPAALASCHRMPDAPDLQGPLAGILACMRWVPGATWLVCACDMPRMTGAALQWLLEGRRPGVWGILPRRAETGPVEPLLALYDPRARPLLENHAIMGRTGPRAIASQPKIATPVLPPGLVDAWRNVNSPDELSR